MMHHDVLDIAEQLAHLDAGRPRAASLRRAISTAYYALFHALAFLCADQLVRWKRPWRFVSPIYRSLDHRRTKTVFVQLSDKHGLGIAAIGQIFISLQQRREDADYNPEIAFGRSETLDIIEQAREAVARIEMLSPEDRLFLSTQLIARTR